LDATILPANARIDTLLFDDRLGAISVTLRGEAVERRVEVTSVAALFGARIRHESLSIVSSGGGGISFGKLAFTAATGIPVGVKKGGPKEKPTAGEELLYALAMRVDKVPELWYLLGTSFNFKKALGPDATYAGETNLRLFVKRLAEFAPRAVQDSFFAAMLGGTPLPPPMESLLEFFRASSARP
jgi:hypothetical protein